MSFEITTNPITDELKALDHQVDLGKDSPFPKSNFLYLLVGGVGSGKTTLCLNLLKIDKEKGGFRKAFNRIYVVSPTAKYDDKFSRLIDEVSAEGNYYDECNDETIGEIIDNLEAYNEMFKRDKKNKGKKPSSLVILDDCISEFSRKRMSKLAKLVLTLRHLKTSVFIMSQKLVSIPPLIRAQARAISFFPTLNRKEEQALVNEINIDEDLFHRLITFASEGPDHPFLHIKLGEGKPVFFKKFDKITLHK